MRGCSGPRTPQQARLLARKTGRRAKPARVSGIRAWPKANPAGGLRLQQKKLYPAGSREFNCPGVPETSKAALKALETIYFYPHAAPEGPLFQGRRIAVIGSPKPVRVSAPPW